MLWNSTMSWLTTTTRLRLLRCTAQCDGKILDMNYVLVFPHSDGPARSPRHEKLWSDQGALGEFLTKTSISPIRRDQARIAMIQASFLP